MDIMRIDSKAVLHMAENKTRFSAPVFLANVTSEYVCDSFLRCRAVIYIGLPNRLLVDQGSQLGKRQVIADIVDIHNVEMQATGTEAHSLSPSDSSLLSHAQAV